MEVSFSALGCCLFTLPNPDPEEACPCPLLPSPCDVTSRYPLHNEAPYHTCPCCCLQLHLSAPLEYEPHPGREQRATLFWSTELRTQPVESHNEHDMTKHPGGLWPMIPIGSYAWSRVSGTVWEELGGVASLWEEVCPCGQALSFKEAMLFPVSQLSLLCDCLHM